MARDLAQPFFIERVPAAALGDELVLQRCVQQLRMGVWIPVPQRISNCASQNGCATLFFTTRTRVRLPTSTSPVLTAPSLRMSSLTEA
jgi:hypothetical protein